MPFVQYSRLLSVDYRAYHFRNIALKSLPDVDERSSLSTSDGTLSVRTETIRETRASLATPYLDEPVVVRPDDDLAYEDPYSDWKGAQGRMRAHRTGACGEVNACAVLLRLFSVSGGRPFGASTITWGKTNDNPTPRVRPPCFNKVSWGCLEFQLANGMNTTYTPSARRTSPLADITSPGLLIPYIVIFQFISFFASVHVTVMIAYIG